MHLLLELQLDVTGLVRDSYGDQGAFIPFLSLAVVIITFLFVSVKSETYNI